LRRRSHRNARTLPGRVAMGDAGSWLKPGSARAESSSKAYAEPHPANAVAPKRLRSARGWPRTCDCSTPWS
jgi:hypothetical protein